MEEDTYHVDFPFALVYPPYRSFILLFPTDRLLCSLVFLASGILHISTQSLPDPAPVDLPSEG